MNETWWITQFLWCAIETARLHIDESDYRYHAYRSISLAEMCGVLPSWEALGLRNDLSFRYYRWLGIKE